MQGRFIEDLLLVAASHEEVVVLDPVRNVQFQLVDQFNRDLEGSGVTRSSPVGRAPGFNEGLDQLVEAEDAVVVFVQVFENRP